MRTTLFFFLLALTAFCAGAQDRVSTRTARLRVPDATTGAKIVVTNDSDVAAGLRTAPRGDETTGYRICIFFDNTQNGRSLNNEALAKFKEHFPGIPGEVIYANPTFKTMVGYCVDMNEASMLLGRVREVFPTSVIVREEKMPVTDLLSNPVGAAADSVAAVLPAEGSF